MNYYLRVGLHWFTLLVSFFLITVYFTVETNLRFFGLIGVFMMGLFWNNEIISQSKEEVQGK